MGTAFLYNAELTLSMDITQVASGPNAQHSAT
jgi:hypothetical protein